MKDVRISAGRLCAAGLCIQKGGLLLLSSNMNRYRVATGCGGGGWMTKQGTTFPASGLAMTSILAIITAHAEGPLSL